MKLFEINQTSEIRDAADLTQAITIALSQVIACNGTEKDISLIPLDKVREIQAELSRYIYTQFYGTTKVVSSPDANRPG